MRYFLITIALCCLLGAAEVGAQRPTFGIGAGYGAAFGINESIEHPLGSHFRFTLLYLKGLSPTLSLEFGGGYTKLTSGENEVSSKYSTDVTPLDIRIRYSPMIKQQWSPFLFGGLGIALFEVTDVPPSRHVSADTAGGNLFVTGGVGLFHQFAPNWACDITLGASTTFEDDLNPTHDERSDGWWHGLIGIHYLFNEIGIDSDGDGLSDEHEHTKYKTDAKNPDSDGDGLLDGDEIHDYQTNPLNRDTDNDEAFDGLEVQTLKTNPLGRDTDGDSLPDGQEYHLHKTNPLNRDTDSDGLTDNTEIETYHTKPYAIDSDGDSLGDGDEINRYRTDPLNQDTDKGSVPDGVEISRGTNPVNASDDKAK